MKLRYLLTLIIIHNNTALTASAAKAPTMEEILKKEAEDFWRNITETDAAKLIRTHYSYHVNPELKPHDPIAQERAKKFKEFYDQQKETERKAKLTETNRAKRAQIQAKKEKEQEKIEKLQNISKNIATRKIQKLYHERFETKQYEKMENFLKDFAQKNYFEFKRLVCTKEYLTETDWFYDFVALMENLNKQKFLKDIESNPLQLNTYLTKYIDQFNTTVYKTFIDIAAEQIEQNHMSWIDAVSIPAPEGTYGFQPDSPLYPIAFYCYHCKAFELILGTILSALPIDEILNLPPPTVIYTDDVADPVYVYYEVALIDGSTTKLLLERDQEVFEEIKTMNIAFLDGYLHSLGLELNEEETILASLISNDFFKPENTGKNLERFNLENLKFEQAHTNWRKKADQIFWLGCLIVDKNIDAFDALGGNAWLFNQPAWVQNILSEFIANLPHAKQKRSFKQKYTAAKPITTKPGSFRSSKTTPKYPSKTTEIITYLPDEIITKEQQLSNLKSSWKKEKRNLLRDLNA